MPDIPVSERPNQAAVLAEEPPLELDEIEETVRTSSAPIHEKTAAILAGASLAIFGLTVLIPIFASAIFGLRPGMADFVERLASIEIGPIGVIFGFYFSDKIRRGLS
jgi:hypothetical protein